MKYCINIVVLFVALGCSGAGTFAAQSAADESSDGRPFKIMRSSAVKAEVGSPAPPFRLDAVVNQEFKNISLADYKGKWLVLFFYPGDFTFVCPTEIKGFNASLADFTAINTEVLAVSADSRFSHLAWVKSGALGTLNYPLLSDFTKQTARSYGVLDEAQGTARRGLFIIDPNGVIQHAVIHSDKVGRSVEETLRVLKALQTAELCPLNWKPGEKTIKR
ncbi:MAG: peroxiredoxin [Desulfuromonadales bacterium]